MSDYTPTTEDVRDKACGQNVFVPPLDEAEFDRWFAPYKEAMEFRKAYEAKVHAICDVIDGDVSEWTIETELEGGQPNGGGEIEDRYSREWFTDEREDHHRTVVTITGPWLPGARPEIQQRVHVRQESDARHAVAKEEQTLRDAEAIMARRTAARGGEATMHYRTLHLVAEEIVRSIRKHGAQTGLPNGTGPTETMFNHPSWGFATLATEATHVTDAKSHAHGDGTVTWADILLEEVFEALAENDSQRLRDELVQVAAVAVKWIALLDSDTAARGESGV